MLHILNLIWVIPGIVGLWTYNRWLNKTHHQAEGWAYLFAVVVFAMPGYYIFEISPISDSYKCLSLAQCGFTKFSIELFSSILLAFLLGYFFAFIGNIRKFSPDPFHECCYLWRKEPVLITLKNNKVYFGVLLDYTKDLRFDCTIRIVSICSGYRGKYGEINWTFAYPKEHFSDQTSKIGTIISQKEIITFSLWDDAIANISELREN